VVWELSQDSILEFGGAQPPGKGGIGVSVGDTGVGGRM
jgi:hypothetical protein